MEVARITSKGQITIPIGIRKKLNVKDGDKVIFIERDSGIMVENSNKIAWENIQKAMEGEAEKAGFKSEADLIQYCREIRQEMWEKNYANND